VVGKSKEVIDGETKELLKLVKDLGSTFGPIFLKNQELNVPIIKRTQWMNFIIMISVCVGVVFLAYSGTIDGSAATGLLGAVIGYVFGHIYSKKEK
jgi:hypothetical protein